MRSGAGSKGKRGAAALDNLATAKEGKARQKGAAQAKASKSQQRLAAKQSGDSPKRQGDKLGGAVRAAAGRGGSRGKG